MEKYSVLNNQVPRRPDSSNQSTRCSVRFHVLHFFCLKTSLYISIYLYMYIHIDIYTHMCIHITFIFIYIHIHSYKTLKRALVDQASFSSQKIKQKLHIKIQDELAMAYSPNVQYEAYKRLDCARARSGSFFFFFLFFLFDFATLKNVFYSVCLFVCFPLQNSFHRGRVLW